MMTTDELSTYYANLLIVQYVTKPKAFATIQAQVLPALMDQLPLIAQDAFNLDTAIGSQLDVLGKYVGASRNNYVASGPVTLTDDDFRKLIKLVVIKNNSGSSLAEIQSLLSMNFPGQILVSDNQAMGLSYVLIESLGASQLVEILASGAYLPAPMGVSVSVTVVPAHTNLFFGFRTYSAPDTTVSPFNNYTLYQKTYPWLSYGGA